jgi:acyl-CoA reductase-like NAD-dependent aldehyde dehydrogenase
MTVSENIAKLGHLIDGRIVRNDQTFPVHDPSTGKAFADAPEATDELLAEAISAAERAAAGWVALGPARRRKVIGEMAAALDQHIGDIVAIATLEKGSVRGSAEAYVASHFMKHTADTEIPVDVIEDNEERSVVVVRKPVGVMAGITPWNAPILIASEKIASSLLVGNTVVLKPSPFTPLGTLALGELWKDIVPPGVLNILAGGDELGAALVRHPAIRMVSFTGSVAAGRHIAQSAGAQLKNLQLELGGNDPAIVLPDVDVDKVAEQIFNVAFLMSGQTCAAIKRLYVHRSIYQPMVAALSRLADAAQPAQGGVDGALDPLTTMPQFERVRMILDDAIGHGAQIAAGGRTLDRDGYFVAATILTDVTDDMKVVAEEQFGPLLPVIPYDDVDDAIAAANATDYGLSGSIWTADIAAGAELAARLECGTTLVNSHAEVAPNIPTGGAKHSGIGRTCGRAGLDAYAELQTQYVYKSPERVKTG